MQQRALHKYHSGGLWTNACCSHPRPESSGDEALHAIDYQVYAYLQMARDGEARKAIERGEDYATKFTFYRPVGPYGMAAAPARYALERGDWKSAANLRPR